MNNLFFYSNTKYEKGGEIVWKKIVVIEKTTTKREIIEETMNKTEIISNNSRTEIISSSRTKEITTGMMTDAIGNKTDIKSGLISSLFIFND